MRYADLLARATGLCVAAAGAALAGAALLVGPAGGVREMGAVAPDALTTPAATMVGTGAALAVAGLAVLVGRGRVVAVSVGGACAAAAVVGLAVGTEPTVGVLGIGVVALALLLAGASTGGHATGSRRST